MPSYLTPIVLDFSITFVIERELGVAFAVYIWELEDGLQYALVESRVCTLFFPILVSSG